MKEQCNCCGKLTHKKNITILENNKQYCFACMEKNFKVTKLTDVYYYEARINNGRPVLRVVNGHPPYTRKKVFKNYKDPAKRGYYEITITEDNQHHYEI